MVWTKITCSILNCTNDIDTIFGIEKFLHDVPVPAGIETLSELQTDEGYYHPIVGRRTSQVITGLLPGMSYYVMIRAKSEAGKGPWSKITGPIVTKADTPSAPTKFEAKNITASSFELWFCLPYDNGCEITGAVGVLERVHGPLAEHEAADNYGNPHLHLACRKVEFNPNHGIEELSEAELYARPAHMHRFGLRGTVKIDQLLAGSLYDFSWACKNKLGLGEYSEPMALQTTAGVPDMPGGMILPDF